jgi:hypothetical protein
VNVFEAHWALVRFREFRRLAVLSWALAGNISVEGRVMYEIRHVADTEVSAMDEARIAAAIIQAGQKRQQLLPTITRDAKKLGIAAETRLQPRIGEIESRVGTVLFGGRPADNLDAIDNCIGAAKVARQRALVRLLVPIYWLIDIPALAVRLPWLILKKAGLPPEIESNVVSNVLKVLLFLAYALIAVYVVGSKVSPEMVRALIPK